MTVSLKPVLPGLRRAWVAVELDRLDDLAVLVQDEALAVDDLEGDLVDVHRVGVGGGVVELPDLGGADGRVLGDRVHPHAAASGTPSVTVPSSASTGPSTSTPVASTECPTPSRSAPAAGSVPPVRRVMAGRTQELRRRGRVGRHRRHDPELQTWPVVSGSAVSKSLAGLAAAERLVRADVARGRSCRPARW